MKSKSAIQLCLLLVSIFFYSNLFSQVTETTNFPAVINAEKFVSYSNCAFRLSTFVPSTAKLNNHNSSFLFSDTTRKKDRDGDGIPDSLDRCPDEKGVIQYDGCPIPDSDNDGVTDDIDKCPTIAGLAKYNGCPPRDDDGDKINDEDDKCPNVPGVARYGGCPVGDADGDGVNDDDDKCVNTPGTVQNAGCPENKKAVGLQGKRRKEKIGVLKM